MEVKEQCLEDVAVSEQGKNYLIEQNKMASCGLPYSVVL
jgi:hypothetical protein